MRRGVGPQTRRRVDAEAQAQKQTQTQAQLQTQAQAQAQTQTLRQAPRSRPCILGMLSDWCWIGSSSGLGRIGFALAVAGIYWTRLRDGSGSFQWGFGLVQDRLGSIIILPWVEIASLWMAGDGW